MPATLLIGPNQKLPLTHAAVMLGVDVRVLRRLKAALLDGQAPKCRDQWVLTVAKLYAAAETDSKDVKVKSVYLALGLAVPLGNSIGISPLTRPAVPVKKVNSRKAADKFNLPEIAPGSKPTNEQTSAVREQMSLAMNKARNTGAGKVAWNHIMELVHWLHAAGQPFQGKLHGYPLTPDLDISKIRGFGGLSEFASRAGPSDYWPFVLPQLDSLPIDVFAATEAEIRYGHVVLLTAEDWGSRMVSAMKLIRTIEGTDAFAAELGLAIPDPGKKTVKTKKVIVKRKRREGGL